MSNDVIAFSSEDIDDMDTTGSRHGRNDAGRQDTPAWDRIPTELHFELTGISLPLGAIAGLQPGAVMRIASSDTLVPVEVLAGGRTIGRGELVSIGDGFGVRLLERLIDGP